MLLGAVDERLQLGVGATGEAVVRAMLAISGRLDNMANMDGATT